MVREHKTISGPAAVSLRRPSSKSPRALPPSPTPGVAAPSVPGPSPATSNLGWLPQLSVVSATGLLILAAANTTARASLSVAQPLFWIGLLTMFAPLVVRLLAVTLTRSARIGLVSLLGLGFYLVKVLHSPTNFTFFDEFSQWQTTDGILQTNHLFSENPLARISPLYPGLQVATSALIDLTGMSVFASGITLLVAARILLVLALYHFYEEIAGSSRIAGIAALLYMANPNFVFFGSQYMYESLALPLMALILFLLARRERARGAERRGLTIAALGGMMALVVTHHMTAFGLTLLLILWTVTRACLYRRRDRQLPGLASVTAIFIMVILVWLALVARETVGYLGAVFTEAAKSIVELVAREETAKQPFQSSTGTRPPLWEQIVGFGSVGLILVALPFSLLHVLRRWRRRRVNALILVFGLMAAAYPGTLALRLTQAGTETSSRASEFLFMAIGLVIAMTVAERWLPAARARARRRWTSPAIAFAPIVLTACIAVLVAGGITVGWAPYARMPGSYLVGADPRSIEPEGIEAARWLVTVVGPHNNLLTDRTNRQLMGSYGRQVPQVRSAGNAHVSELIFSQEFGPSEEAIIRKKGIRYVVADERLTTSLPLKGVYFELSEPNAYAHVAPMPAQSFAKFDDIGGVSRIYDSGNIVIYDVGVILTE